MHHAGVGASYRYMRYFKGAVKKVRRSVLCVRMGIHKKLDFKLEWFSKMRMSGFFSRAGRKLIITNIYVAPEGSSNWGDELLAGAEAWEDRFVAGGWNRRGNSDMIQALSGERAQELQELAESEKVSKERMPERDCKVLWSSWPRKAAAACQKPGGGRRASLGATGAIRGWTIAMGRHGRRRRDGKSCRGARLSRRTTTA